MELNCIVDGIRLVGTAIKKLNIENNIADNTKRLILGIMKKIILVLI